jgi:hypothetical protein
MASRRQITANRRNARKSTGPRTSVGKLRSRSNALKHGLTAETIVTVFENPNDYTAFERLMVRDYAPRSVIEHQLVVRLSSLLWRLRRATAVETGLFSIQGRILQDRRVHRDIRMAALTDERMRLHKLFGLDAYMRMEKKGSEPVINLKSSTKGDDLAPSAGTIFVPPIASASRGHTTPAPQTDLLAQCFLRVARLDDKIFERVSRYEGTLWRQTQAILGKLRLSRTGR